MVGSYDKEVSEVVFVSVGVNRVSRHALSIRSRQGFLTVGIWFFPHMISSSVGEKC